MKIRFPPKTMNKGHRKKDKSQNIQALKGCNFKVIIIEPFQIKK